MVLHFQYLRSTTKFLLLIFKSGDKSGFLSKQIDPPRTSFKVTLVVRALQTSLAISTVWEVILVHAERSSNRNSGDDARIFRTSLSLIDGLFGHSNSFKPDIAATPAVPLQNKLIDSLSSRGKLQIALKPSSVIPLQPDGQNNHLYICKKTSRVQVLRETTSVAYLLRSHGRVLDFV